MIKITSLLAEADLVETLAGSVHTAHSGFRDMLTVLGALFGISLIITLWLVFFRKKPRVRKHHHHHRPAVNAMGQANGGPPPEGAKVRRKWKRPRRPHRPLNPTLAETGGLPPPRDGQAPPPSLL